MSTATLFDYTPDVLPLLTVTPRCLHGLPLTFTWAGFSNGHRQLSASIIDTWGRVGACRFYSLWVEASEWTFGKGEPNVWAQRRPDDGAWQRLALTDAAAKALRHDLGQVFAGDAFDRAWRAAFTGRHETATDGSKTQAARARAIADWWDRHGNLAELVAAHPSDVTYTPIVTPVGQHPFKVKRPNHHGGDWTWAQPVADIRLGGELVGYLASDSDPFIPVDELRLA